MEPEKVTEGTLMQQALERADDQEQRQLEHARAAEEYHEGIEETELLPGDHVLLGNRRARIVERVTGTLFVVQLEEGDLVFRRPYCDVCGSDKLTYYPEKPAA